MNMKMQIINISNEFVNGNDVEKKKLGKIILKNINNFQCYDCLDTNKCWRPRHNQFWASMDGRGSYDVVRCSKCSDGYWVRCSHSNSIHENGITIFKVNDTNIDYRLKELQQIYKGQINEPEPEWWLYEKKCIYQKTTEFDMQVNIKKLANIVLSSIRLQGGDLSEIATLAKDLTIDMSSTLTEDNNTTEVIRYSIIPRHSIIPGHSIIPDDEDKHVYLIMKLEIAEKQRSLFGKAFRSKKFTYTATYTILIPKNDIAKAICDALMNTKIIDRLNRKSSIF